MATFVYSNAGTYDYPEYEPDARYRFNGAYLGLHALVVGHVLAVLISSCIYVKRRADPARTAFTWLKIAGLLLFIGAALAVAAWAIMIVIDGQKIDTDPKFMLVRAFLRTSNLYRLFFAWANAAVMVMLVDLGLGIYSVVRAGRIRGHKIAKYLTLFAAFVVWALATAKYGVVAAANTNAASALPSILFTDHRPSVNNDGRMLMAAMDLTSAFEIISWVVSLFIVAFSIFIKVKADYILRSATSVHLIASIMYLLRCTWRFAFVIKWVIPHVLAVPLYIEILHAILDRWVLVFILSLVYVIGRKKRGGLYMGGKFGSMDSEAPPPMRTSNHHW